MLPFFYTYPCSLVGVTEPSRTRPPFGTPSPPSLHHNRLHLGRDGEAPTTGSHRRPHRVAAWRRTSIPTSPPSRPPHRLHPDLASISMLRGARPSGYGGTTTPPEPSSYTALHIVSDIVALLDALHLAVRASRGVERRGQVDTGRHPRHAHDTDAGAAPAQRRTAAVHVEIRLRSLARPGSSNDVRRLRRIQGRQRSRAGSNPTQPPFPDLLLSPPSSELLLLWQQMERRRSTGGRKRSRRR